MLAIFRWFQREVGKCKLRLEELESMSDHFRTLYIKGLHTRQQRDVRRLESYDVALVPPLLLPVTLKRNLPPSFPANIYLSLTSFSCLYCYLRTNFTTFFSVSTVGFEQVKASWILKKITRKPSWWCPFESILNSRPVTLPTRDSVAGVFE